MTRTFTFHLGLVLAAVAIAGLAVRAHRMVACAGGCAIAIIVASFVRLPERAEANPKPESADTLTVFTANMLYFNTQSQPVLDQIAAEKPDIVLMQEYTPAMHAVIAPALAGVYPHSAHAFKSGSYGQAVFSRRPFVGEPIIHTHGSNRFGEFTSVGNGPQIAVRIELAGREVTVQGVHTSAPGGLGSFVSQRQEFAWLEGCIAGRATPIILGGDFNATNESQHMGALGARGMRDALNVNTFGRRCTWPDRTVLQWLPGIRIDHVVYSEELVCETAHVGASTGSDHLPVIARVRWKDAADSGAVH